MDSFTVSATKCARRMATFVKILNKEDISTMDNRDNIREVSKKTFVLSPGQCIFSEMSTSDIEYILISYVIFYFRLLKETEGATENCEPSLNH